MTLFLFRLGARTLLRRPARSIITLGSIALGVAALAFLGAIMVGVNDAMIDNSVSLRTGHALIQSDNGRQLVAHWRERKDRRDEIVAVLPRLLSVAMLTTESGAASVQLVGVVPAREMAMSAVPARVVHGRYLAATGTGPEIVVGEKAARFLSAGPGDSLTLQLAGGQTATATVVGVFRTGIARFDENLTYVDLDWMQTLVPDSAKGEAALFFRKGTQWDDVERPVRSLLARGESVAPWEDLLPELEQLTRLNVVSMVVVILLVVIMLAAGVSNTVLVSVLDRYREFGILKALGTTPGEIIRLVLIETTLLCLLAGAIGLAAGALITVATSRTGIDLGRLTSENIHFVLSSVVYPRLTWDMAFVPPLTVLAAALAASLWPAAIAARRRAADVLRQSP